MHRFDLTPSSLDKLLATHADLGTKYRAALNSYEKADTLSAPYGELYR